MGDKASMERQPRVALHNRSLQVKNDSPEDSFNGPEIFTAKGLPWSYSAQGILMKHAGQAQRYRQPTLEKEASEEELNSYRSRCGYSGGHTCSRMPTHDTRDHTDHGWTINS